LEADLFEDEYLRGMIPILFADNAESASTAMAANPVTARKDINKLQKLLIAPESTTPETALQVKAVFTNRILKFKIFFLRSA
jgi:hypothetical protein